MSCLRDVAPVRDQALRAGVATDREVLGARLSRTTLYRRVMELVGGTATLFIVPSRALASNSLPIPHLTATELDPLDYLELGWGTREIAEARGTSFFTVRNQLSTLYRRLEVTNRAEAIGLRRRASQ